MHHLALGPLSLWITFSQAGLGTSQAAHRSKARCRTCSPAVSPCRLPLHRSRTHRFIAVEMPIAPQVVNPVLDHPDVPAGWRDHTENPERDHSQSQKGPVAWAGCGKGPVPSLGFCDRPKETAPALDAPRPPRLVPSWGGLDQHQTPNSVGRPTFHSLF